MKKQFLLLAVILVLFVSCDNSAKPKTTDTSKYITVKNMSSYDIDFYGKVKGSNIDDWINCDRNGTPIKVYLSSTVEGEFYPRIKIKKSSESIECFFNVPELFENGKIVSITDNTPVKEEKDPSNIHTVANISKTGILTIKNSSSYDLLDVKWKSISFSSNSSNSLEAVIEKGAQDSKNVEPGYGYLYFSKKTDKTLCRTKETVCVKKYGEVIYEITDNTEVDEINNENEINTFIISSVDDLQNIVYNDGINVIFKLANDIDGKGEYWTPIEEFKGTLIGNGYAIRNFKINTCSSLNDDTFFCGFIYKNTGKIENICFIDIDISASKEYQTFDWRYMNTGLIARNEGTIDDVHLQSITVNSHLNYKLDQQSGGYPKQKTTTGGLVGVNQGAMSYCSISNSTIYASTDAKANYCDTATVVGGICGEANGSVSNMLAVDTNVTAKSRGGFWGGLGMGDGTLTGYAGNIFGIVNVAAEKLVSFHNDTPTVSFENAHDNPVHVSNAGDIIGFTDSSNIRRAYSSSTGTLVGNYSNLGANWTTTPAAQIKDWEYWSLINPNYTLPENYKGNRDSYTIIDRDDIMIFPESGILADRPSVPIISTPERF